jgi:hypothetical protein
LLASVGTREVVTVPIDTPDVAPTLISIKRAPAYSWAIGHCHVNTTATQKYKTSPFITLQQLRHPTGSLLQLGTGAMFCVRSDGVEP